MAALRSASTLTMRLAAMPKPPAVRASSLLKARAAVPLAARRALSTSGPQLKKTEVIKETEVPVSVYTPDSKGVASSNTGDHFSIPVKGVAPVTTPPQELEQTEEKISTLAPNVFRSMPPTMQKMSVMGKVIVVTGYVLA